MMDVGGRRGFVEGIGSQPKDRDGLMSDGDRLTVKN
jgi:hypothetical protein